ncbi:alpha-crystallin A chain-like [Mytilus californianus]|uniref:alpha-crystallin A chain-like n=1 Tax=Mytilus californianus TaxID=6549 RepID=UPI002245EF13|nr:alpha-crystallin A chain-like [Mytilus californianus]
MEIPVTVRPSTMRKTQTAVCSVLSKLVLRQAAKMLVRFIPRAYRQITSCPRWMSSRRNVPMFGRRRDPGDSVRNDNFFVKPVESQFRDMANAFDSFTRRPWYNEDYVRSNDVAEAFAKSEVAEVKYDSKKLEINLDVSMYSPEELNVTIAEDRMIIKGKHEQKEDNYGFITREFTREFVVPENIDADRITSTLSEEGMLMIQGRARGAEEANERVVNIEKREERR